MFYEMYLLLSKAMLNLAEYVEKKIVVIPQFIFSLVKKLMRTSNNKSKLNGPEKL